MIKLHSLRRQIFNISQSPCLLSGSVRTTLDPDFAFGDEELLEILRKIHSFTSDLSFAINEGGTNISQGQQQVLCLARAILSQRELIIMDEATSTVDADGYAVIRTALKDALPDSTMIVVAHRLATVAQFHKILVMEGGRLVEFGPPTLLCRQKGAFWKLVCHSPDADTLVKTTTAEQTSSQ